jgi:hypothetical protein
MAAMEAIRDITEPVSLLVNNPFATVGIERITADFAVTAEETLARLESIRLENNSYRPGDTVRVFATLRTFKKETAVETLELKLPEDLPPGNATVVVCDARASRSLDQADAPSRYQPQDLDQLIGIIRERSPLNRLVVRLRLPDSGVAIKGVELPSLPPSMLAIVDSPRTAGLTPLRKSVQAHIETPYVVSGSESLPILVRPKQAP